MAVAVRHAGVCREYSHERAMRLRRTVLRLRRAGGRPAGA